MFKKISLIFIIFLLFLVYITNTRSLTHTLAQEYPLQTTSITPYVIGQPYDISNQDFPFDRGIISTILNCPIINTIASDEIGIIDNFPNTIAKQIADACKEQKDFLSIVSCFGKKINAYFDEQRIKHNLTEESVACRPHAQAMIEVFRYHQGTDTTVKLLFNYDREGQVSHVSNLINIFAKDNDKKIIHYAFIYDSLYPGILFPYNTITIKDFPTTKKECSVYCSCEYFRCQNKINEYILTELTDLKTTIPFVHFPTSKENPRDFAQKTCSEYCKKNLPPKKTFRTAGKIKDLTCTLSGYKKIDY